MKTTIFTLFGLKKKSSKKSNNVKTLDQVYSPSSSVSSFNSDLSTDSSAPQTPTSMSMQETRGIFRTLDPVWYFHSSLLPPNHQQKQQEGGEWVQFDETSQYALEHSFSTKPECALTQTPLGPCTVSFKPSLSQTKRLKDPQARHSVMGLTQAQHASMPTLPTRQAVGRTLEFNKNVRRTISPVWWYEQDQADGAKGMCRFDYRNQVRLEALSEGRTRLVLTDDAFNVPFTVVLDEPKQREMKEEVRGFLYLEPVSTAFQLAYDATQADNKMQSFQVEDPSYEDEAWGSTLTRRFSV